MALHATCLASQVTSNHAPHRRLGSTLVVYRSGLQQHASHCYHAAFPSCWPVLASPSHFSRLVFPPLRTFLLLCQIFTLGHAQRLKSHARSVAARYFDRHRRALPPLVAGDRVLLKTAVLCRPLWLATACWSKLPCSAAPFSMLPYCAARPSPCRATLTLLRWSSPLQATRPLVIAVPADLHRSGRKTVNFDNVKLASPDSPLYAPGPVAFDERGRSAPVGR